MQKVSCATNQGRGDKVDPKNPFMIPGTGQLKF